MKQRALITGGCGHTGRRVCDALHSKGYYVVVLDDLRSKGSLHPEYWSGRLSESFDFVFMHMSCEEFFEDDVEYFGKNPKWDLIIHLAKEDDPITNSILNMKLLTWIENLMVQPGAVIFDPGMLTNFV